VVRFNTTTLWHIDAVEWAPSTASFVGNHNLARRRVPWSAKGDFFAAAISAPVLSLENK
jgi:hypothetical protein